MGIVAYMCMFRFPFEPTTCKGSVVYGIGIDYVLQRVLSLLGLCVSL